MAFSKTIQMYIFNGDPNGRIMCELSNWNGRIYKISRRDINLFSERNDAENTGIYFLFGKDDMNNDTVYIGEAEKMFTRIKQHLNSREQWNDCIVVISKDNNLNKAHAKYLENKFYNLATDSGRFFLLNNTIPTCSSVSEYDEAMLEEFIENTKLLVNTLGYKVFDEFDKNNIMDNHSEVFYITAARGADARGAVVSDGFAVFKDSVIANSVTPSMPKHSVVKREYLIESGIVDNQFKFTQNYVFSNPSLAAAVVMGRSANGLTEWKTDDNRTLKSVQN